MPSQLTFIYDSKKDKWTKGPSLLEARAFHASCAIQSDDGSTQSIIIVGGCTSKAFFRNHYSKSTEILSFKDQKWIQGPELPCDNAPEYRSMTALCVELPEATDIACVVIGGNIGEEYCSSNVYGLNKSMTEWTSLGKTRKGRYRHIALPFS